MTIFISYRRADTAEVTRRLYDALAHRYGPENVFKDIDSVPSGVDFRQHIVEALASCRMLAAVIGEGWLDTRDGENRRRIDDEDDYVRIEIETALGLRIPVVPVLVGEVSMFRSDALPPSLKPLANQNAVRLRPGPDFERDLERLMRSIEPHQPGERVSRADATRPVWKKRLFTAWRSSRFDPEQGPFRLGRLCPYCGKGLMLDNDPSDPTMLRCATTFGGKGRCTFRLLRRVLALPWLNFSVIGYHDACKDLWLLQVWGRLLRGVQTPSADFALARTG